MNAQIQEFWNLNRMYTQLRDELMQLLSDEDLAYSPGGGNPTLGELCRELGETQYAYVQSFKTFEVDFSYRTNDDKYVKSVAALQAWYKQLDTDLEAALETVTDDDVAGKQMERGGYQVPRAYQPGHIARSAADLLRQSQRLRQGDGPALYADVARLDRLSRNLLEARRPAKLTSAALE